MGETARRHRFSLQQGAAMPRNLSNPPVWPRRFMMLTVVIIAVVAIIGFNAMANQNFTLAFPMFASVVALLLFMVVLMFMQNRR
jgi:hypothetical protein